MASSSACGAARLARKRMFSSRARVRISAQQGRIGMGGCKDQFTAARGGGFLRQQREGDDGFVLRSNFIAQFGFEIVWDRHFAGRDLFGRGADEAELAMTQAFDA